MTGKKKEIVIVKLTEKRNKKKITEEMDMAMVTKETDTSSVTHLQDLGITGIKCPDTKLDLNSVTRRNILQKPVQEPLVWLSQKEKVKP